MIHALDDVEEERFTKTCLGSRGLTKVSNWYCVRVCSHHVNLRNSFFVYNLAGSMFAMRKIIKILREAYHLIDPLLIYEDDEFEEQ